jgi:hypothetical protein
MIADISHFLTIIPLSCCLIFFPESRAGTVWQIEKMVLYLIKLRKNNPNTLHRSYIDFYLNTIIAFIFLLRQHNSVGDPRVLYLKQV